MSAQNGAIHDNPAALLSDFHDDTYISVTGQHVIWLFIKELAKQNRQAAVTGKRRLYAAFGFGAKRLFQTLG